MPLSTTQDLLFLMLAIAVPVVAAFLCWALYEIARMFHQTNIVMTETREKISRVERAVLSIKERFESATGYLAMLAEGGKSLMSYFHKRNEEDDEAEGEDEEFVVKRRTRKK